MMKQKENDLLRYLLDNQDHFVTSEELAEVLSLSSRTIRNYAKRLKTQLNMHGATFEAKPSLGYRLHISQPVAFDLYLTKNYQLADDSVEIDVSDRQKYILNKLVIENEAFPIDDLMDRLFVTRSTLSKDLSMIRKELMPYELVIDSKPNKGIFITGLERNRRHFILDYFFNHSDNSLQHYMSNKSFFKRISFDQITIIVLDECRESGIHLTDFTIQNIVLYLALSVQRMAEGFELQNIQLDDKVETRSVYIVAQKIIRRIENGYQIHVPESEVEYLTIQLLANGKNTTIISDAGIHDDIDSVLQKIELEIGYPISQDYELKKNLIEHLKPMLVRLEQGLQLKNPLLHEIKTNYLPYFLDAKRYISWSTYLSQFEINDDEVAYLTLHLMAAVEKYQDFNKPRTLIICATGYGSAQLLKNRLKKEYSEYLNIVGVKGYYEVDNLALAEVDLIISAIDLSTQIFKVPVIQVSIFLTESDIKKINHFFYHSRTNLNHHIEINDESSLENDQLNYFEQFTDESYFKIWQDSTTREEVLDQLSDMVTKNESTSFKKELLDQIDQRELLSAITFSNTIAVPHPAKALSKVPQIAIGVIPNGLKWSDKYTNIKLVFLLSPSYWNNQGLTAITQTIVALVENPEAQSDLISVKDFYDFQQKFVLLMKGGRKHEFRRNTGHRI